MTQTTEAACLLQSGSMYQRRIGFRTPSGEMVFAGVKPGAVSIYFDDAPIYHFDLDGRWQRAFVAGTHYLKGLDAAVRSIDRDREQGSMVLRRETLTYAVAADLDDSVRSTALGLLDALDRGRLKSIEPPGTARRFAPEEFRSFLESVSAWDSAAWFAHRERYLATYGPLPFLPPDSPNALVLQATLGHADGRAFGGAKPAEPYIRSPAEFLEHARAVRLLTGRRIAQHRGVFLGGADALRRPLTDVLNDLGTIAEVFPIGPKQLAAGDRWDDFPAKLGSVHAFLDDFGPTLPDLGGWRELKAAHLNQVTLGVESGEPAIRASYGKVWRDDDLRSTIADLKAAEIGVGMVVLVGLMGKEAAVRHVEATTALLVSAILQKGDLVTLIDARTFADQPGGDLLSDDETAAQVVEFKRRLAGGPKVVTYNPAKGRA